MQSFPAKRTVMSQHELTVRIKERARALGFELVGIARATPAETAEAFRDWVEAGQHGEMAYMARDVERRIDPRRVMPEAASIVVVGLNYKSDSEAGTRGRGDAGTRGDETT